MADIFLSYNNRDREAAHRLAAALEGLGWSVWWDHEVPAGRSWRDLIEEQLETMRCMVVLWSESSVDSDWVCEEADEGRKKRCLVPARIADVVPPAGFRSIQAADLIGWDGDPASPKFRRLARDLAARLGEPPAGWPAAGGAAERDRDRDRHRRHERSPLPRWAAPVAALAIAGLALIGWQLGGGERSPDVVPHDDAASAAADVARRADAPASVAPATPDRPVPARPATRPDAAPPAEAPSTPASTAVPDAAPAARPDAGAAPGTGTLPPPERERARPEIRRPPPDTAATADAAATLPRPSRPAPARPAADPRCAALTERASLETLTDDQRRFLREECSR